LEETSNRREFYVEYLHKRDAVPIFDILRWNYYHASEVRSHSERAGQLVLEIGLSPGLPDSRLTVGLGYLGERALVIRASAPGAEHPTASPVVTGESSGQVPCELRDTGDFLEYGTKALRAIVNKRPFQIRLVNSDGDIFFEQYLEGVNRHFPTYPMCFKLLEGGETHLVESIKLENDESIYGLGERFGPFDKRGQSLAMWNSDTTLTSSDRSYKSIPFYMSSRGYGLFVTSTAKMSFEVGSGYNYNALSFESWSDELQYVIFYGPSFRDILKMYSEMTGRPPVPPLWSFGLWMSRCMYKNRREIEEVAEKLRANAIPTDVVHLDPRWLRNYCDLVWNEEDFDDPADMIKNLRSRGFRLCLWEQPYVPEGTEMYAEGLAKGFFARAEDGNVVHVPDFVRKRTAIVDFTNPGAREWYKEKHRRLAKMGVAAFKCDMGEAVPEEAVFHNGKTGIEMHNQYPLHYQGAVYEALQEANGEGVVWGRSGCAGIQRYPLQWSGDSHTTFEDMACVLRGGLSYSMSGVPFWSHDIGGFQGPKPSPELYVRWAQWGLLSSHSRCHGTTPREPWEYGDEALSIFRQFDRLRYSLLPYLYSLAREASETGMPLVRSMMLEFQEDPATRQLGAQFMLGRSLLVVPVLVEGGRAEYYLPKGVWLGWFDGEERRGGTYVEEVVPLSEIPLYVRKDSLIPTIEPQNYVGEESVREIILEAFINEDASAMYYFDGESFSMSASRTAEGFTFRLGPSQKAWILRIRGEDAPRRVKVNGELADWIFFDGCLQVRLSGTDKVSRFDISLGCE